MKNQATCSIFAGNNIVEFSESMWICFYDFENLFFRILDTFL